MTDIKTKEIHTGYVRTIDHAACISEHVRNAAIKMRELGEHDENDDSGSASSYAGDDMAYAAKDAAIASTRAAKDVIDGARGNMDDSGDHVGLKDKIDMLRRSSGTDGIVSGPSATDVNGLGADAGSTGWSGGSGSYTGTLNGSDAARRSVANGTVPNNTVANSKKMTNRTVPAVTKKSGEARTMENEVEKSRVLARKVDSARKAGTIKSGEKGISRAGNAAFKGIEKAVAAMLRAMRAAIESTKALIVALSAGGITAVVIVIICVLFGAAFFMFGDESSSNYTPVNAEVDAYTELITKCAGKYGIPEYVDLIKAVMMQESGGRGKDPMQCSESPYNKKYPKKPGGITDPEYSIDCGVHYLANCLKLAKCEGPLDMDRIRLAIQGYNYGNGYISWAIKRDGGYTVQNAAVFSREQAKKHGWKSYGDKLYAAHVLRYYPYGNYNYGIGNAEIVKVAAKEIGNVGGEKYWRWYGFKSHVAWCTIFVSWCADKCGYVKAGIIPKYSNCRHTMHWFQSKNQWQHRGYKPAAGDIILFDWQGDGKADHIGIVEDCDGKLVHTIEGNSHNRCRRKTYTINSSKILGYGVPKY